MDPTVSNIWCLEKRFQVHCGIYSSEHRHFLKYPDILLFSFPFCIGNIVIAKWFCNCYGLLDYMYNWCSHCVFLRWYNHLNPAIKKDAWTLEEELTLIQCHQKYGNKWTEIAKLLPGRYSSYSHVRELNFICGTLLLVFVKGILITLSQRNRKWVSEKLFYSFWNVLLDAMYCTSYFY